MDTTTPRSGAIGTMPADVAANLRIVDATTGEELRRVTAFDADAGTVTRMDVDEGGNLVREGDSFRVITEDRAIRAEWIVATTVGVDVQGDGLYLEKVGWAPADDASVSGNVPTAPIVAGPHA